MQRIIGMITVVIILSCLQSAFAVSGPHYNITATTQYEQGLEFTLTTTPERDDTLIVRLEIPQKGKLENLAGLQMELNDGKTTLLLAPLSATTHDGTRSLAFQIARKLVPQCYVNLFVKVDPRYSICYAVSLKGYIPAAAVDPG